MIPVDRSLHHKIGTRWSIQQVQTTLNIKAVTTNPDLDDVEVRARTGASPPLMPMFVERRRRMKWWKGGEEHSAMVFWLHLTTWLSIHLGQLCNLQDRSERLLLRWMGQNTTIEHHYSLFIINLYNLDILCRDLLASHTPCHLLTRQDSWAATLGLTGGAHWSMGQRNTVTSPLPFEPPSLHTASKTHSSAFGSCIHKLSFLKPRRWDHLSNAQQACFISNFELYQMSFGADLIGGVMA